MFAEINYKFISLKKLNNMFNKFGLLVIIIFSLIIFSPSLGNFFWGDDWYLLRLANITSLREFINFFSFLPTPQSISFYRPLSTQVFFFAFYQLFGLNATAYHIFQLILFSISLYLVYLLGEKLLEKSQALLATLFYGISSTNFPRLYYISATQEITMVMFTILGLIFYLKTKYLNLFLSIMFYIFGLMSKETAVVFPIIVFCLDVINKKIQWKRWCILAVITISYLCLHTLNLGSDITESYIFDFNLKKMINTLFWYLSWSLGTPELLVDYISSGFHILPKFFTDFPTQSRLIIFLTLTTLFTFIVLIYLSLKRIDRFYLFFASFFLIALLPVIFLPWHKFSLQLTLPLVGFCFLLSKLIFRQRKIFYLGWVFIGLFVVNNLFTNIISYQSHYSVKRSNISKLVLNYFEDSYPTPPQENYFEFINDTADFGKDWGSSKQISQAISESNLFKVLYKDPRYVIYYEDIAVQKPIGKSRIPISTSMFLK